VGKVRLALLTSRWTLYVHLVQRRRRQMRAIRGNLCGISADDARDEVGSECLLLRRLRERVIRVRFGHKSLVSLINTYRIKTGSPGH
jgi:hypothetical protein